MRIPAMLYAARTPQNEKTVPFKEILPLRLRNKVSGKSDSQNDVACLQEMSILFACLKTYEFTESSCSKEISNFQKCYNFYLDKNFALKQSDSAGIIAPGRKLNYKQLNKYMKLYPNPK